ncbi:MAG: hypothetical protein CMJ75_11865 [Planctomycetaceae bacterium]|nr:hypothetical protein [Planctomycetaceae bacterium]
MRLSGSQPSTWHHVGGAAKNRLLPASHPQPQMLLIEIGLPTITKVSMREHQHTSLAAKAQLIACTILVWASAISGCQEQPAATTPAGGDTNQNTKAIAPLTRTQQNRFVDEKRYYRSQDKFLPADFPRFVSAEDAVFLEDDDEVLGFVVNDQARAYGLQATCYHHVINDLIGKQPIAVTY